MLEFLWSGSRKPAPADRGEAAGVPPQSPGERPEPEALGQSVEPSRCAEDPNPLSPGSQAESSEPPPAAAERQAVAELGPEAAGADLPTALGLARRAGRQ